MSFFRYLFVMGVAASTSDALAASFPLGQDDGSWGRELGNVDENLPLKIKLGARLQTITKHSESTEQGGDQQGFSDFYIRRARLQFQANYEDDVKFYMDVRNDDANKIDKGEGDFNIGDAYVQIKSVLGIEGIKLRAFRAKVDVSRSETVSSSKLLLLDRAHVADAAAQYVSHNRRASNVQLLGTFEYLSFQLVAGDGVHSAKFFDAKGNKLGGSIDGQNFMVGGKVRLYPIKNWEDKRLRESYFAEGQHFSFGVGTFYLGGIEYQNSAATQIDQVDRSLTNFELSFHFRNFSLLSEYFYFEGVVEDFSASTKNEGSSEGYFVQGEYVLTDLYYLSPFLRYEKWDRFKELSEYGQNSFVGGVNWYLKGNKIRMGLFYQFDQIDRNLQSADNRGRVFENEKSLKLTSMWLF